MFSFFYELFIYYFIIDFGDLLILTISSDIVLQIYRIKLKTKYILYKYLSTVIYYYKIHIFHFCFIYKSTNYKHTIFYYII